MFKTFGFQRQVNMTEYPGAVVFPFNNADLPFDPRITFTRSTIANRFNSTGTLTSAAINLARANANQDYNPSTLAARGFLIEAGATNQIRNPRAEGASAPSTLPTNWSAATIAGIAPTVATTTVNGIQCLAITYAGTPSSTANGNIFFETATQIVAANGQTWAASAFVALSAGTLTNVGQLSLRIFGLTAAGSFVETSQNTSFTPNATLTRVTGAGTFANASTERARSNIQFGFTNGQAVNFTLLIGGPQLEQNAFATSLILPPVASPAATARGSDNASILSLPSIGFSATQGFVYAEFMLEGIDAAAFPRIVDFSDGTFDNVIRLALNGAAPRLAVVVGGVTQAAVTTGASVTANTLVKVAGSWAANNFRYALNGTAASEDTSGSIPTVTQMRIGSGSDASNYLNGWIRRVQYGPQLLTSAQLAAMTA